MHVLLKYWCSTGGYLVTDRCWMFFISLLQKAHCDQLDSLHLYQ